jgi:hypothetical protein
MSYWRINKIKLIKIREFSIPNKWYFEQIEAFWHSNWL